VAISNRASICVHHGQINRVRNAEAGVCAQMHLNSASSRVHDRRINIGEKEGKRGWVLLRQSLHDPLLVRKCLCHTRMHIAFPACFGSRLVLSTLA